MQKLLFVLLTSTLLVSCNIYSPFAQKSSTEDLVQEGRKCLHDGNYSCAIEAYNLISDPETKNEKLCQLYLTQGGLTLSVLITTVTQNSSKVLGDVAQLLLPWSSEKSTAFDNAKTACEAYSGLASTVVKANQSVLLKFLSLIGHCSIRIARTDQWVATSNSDTACTTGGNGNGTLTQSDVGDNSDGSITSVGMCPADVTSCNEDIASLSAASLTSAGLSEMKTAFESIPEALRTSNAAVNAVRGAIRDSVR